MTHHSIPKKVRESIGISDNLIRISVGIEDVNDLINDLDYALKILAQLDQEKELRYLNAKENLRKALDLDPENKEAKVFYKMLSKTIEREFPSGL